MPHCILEYSSDIVEMPDIRGTLVDVNRALIDLDFFAPGDIKSRAVMREDVVVAGGESDVAFVALRIEILEGRTDEEKVRVSEAAFAVLRRAFRGALDGGRCNLTVQIADIHAASYRRQRQNE